MSQLKSNKTLINWDLVSVNPNDKNWDWRDLFYFWGVNIQSVIAFSLITSLYMVYNLNTFVVFFGTILGSFLVYIFSNLIGKPSQKFGLPFVVMLRSSLGFRGAKFFDDFKIDISQINEKSTIFEGTANEAVRLFPKNINVSALLSLSGLGSHETIVKIVADPETKKNTHEIFASGKFGQITTKIENIPDSKNPRTSRLAILSAIETIKSICISDIKIGT